MDSQGRWVEDMESITTAFTNFYTTLLQGSNHRTPLVPEIVGMGKILNDQHRRLLDCNFTDKEIKEAMFSIPSNKALGLDGYNSQFFKATWNITGGDICQAVRDFFKIGKLLKEVSITTLTMVPKVQTPSTVGDFRPIACCSTIYKCISKLLCSRLSYVLPDIISPNQEAFVNGRSIMHNALICQDLMRFYRPSQIQDCCMFKLDVKMAYDTVSWGFMADFMKEIGFPTHFIELIMVCITSPQYSLMINGIPSPLIKPSRGLRQGDPLSPLLFTLCMEYFTRIMKKVSLEEGYKFHPLCKKLDLNHLCFADDILMFSRGDIHTVTLNLAGLQIFSRSTGLEISAAKSEVYCAWVATDILHRIRDLSGFKVGKLPFTYLGVPMSPKRIQPHECEKLVDKMCAKIKVWSSRNLSYAGRLQLVNSVLMSISTYWCQIFLLPNSVIQNIIGVCRAFLWHGTAISNKMSPVSWEEVCKPKQEGGLGIRSLVHWNTAAVGKHVWAIAQKKDNLWVRWVHTIYIKDTEWRTYAPTQICSWVWKSFCKIKDILIQAQVDMTQRRYSIKKVYEVLRPTGTKVYWDKAVWCKAATPKHQFITWLGVRQRLMTRDRLIRMGLATENSCCLCNRGVESHSHLFFDCEFSRNCWKQILEWLNAKVQHYQLQQMIQWIARSCKGDRIRRQAFCAAVTAMVYALWRARNDLLWSNKPWTVDQVVDEVKFSVKNRILFVNRNSNRLNGSWFQNL
ncbi:hypothetical protein RDABS01_032175 [Bienertia sinuspersici]